MVGHGQTLANRTKPGPSLRVEKWLCLCYLLMFLLSKTAWLKVENSAQTTFRFSPVRYRTPQVGFITSHFNIHYCKGLFTRKSVFALSQLVYL